MDKKLQKIMKNLFYIKDESNYKMFLKEYYTLNKMCKTLDKRRNDFNDFSPLKYEDYIYSENNVNLTESEKIVYELKRIKGFILKNKLYHNSDKIYFLLKFIYDSGENADLLEIKKQILSVEIQLGMTVGFYSVTYLMIDDLDKSITDEIKRMRLER